MDVGDQGLRQLHPALCKKSLFIQGGPFVGGGGRCLFFSFFPLHPGIVHPTINTIKR